MQALRSADAVTNVSDIEGVLVRHTTASAVNPPLCVSVTRALAAVCALQRITVYDLNDEEEEEDEDDDAAMSADHHTSAAGSESMDVDS